MKRKLTPQQIKFANNYIESGNAMQSAIDAGYSKAYAKSSAGSMRENVGIKSYIDKRMKQIASDKIMNAQEALELITRIANGKELETVVVSTPTGAYETEIPANLKVRLSAAKEILKRYPDNDEMLKAQYRKLNADADTSESKAKIAKAQADMLLGNGVELEDDGFIDAITAKEDEIWSSDGDEED